jgi:predicted AAA+ superfamily ATPase
MPNQLAFSDLFVQGEVISDLRRMNPWWEANPAQALPPTRRHLVGSIHRRLERKLAPIVVVRGPRQIGKSTAQNQVIEDLLNQGTAPAHLFRVQWDDLAALSRIGREPILRAVEWYENAVLAQPINSVARAGGRVYLFFDEVQNLRDWDVQLKSLVDLTSVQVVMTGGSALRIE